MSINYLVPKEFESQVGEVTKALMPLLTEKRIAKMQEVASKRSRKVCAVFEKTHHAHNVSAILRTLDSFGFLDVFFLYDNPDMKFRPSDAIDRSSSKWLMPKASNSIAKCAEQLKANGYKIALISRPDFSKTSEYYKTQLPSFSTAEINSANFLNLSKDTNIALIFGTELYGVSEEWTQYADLYLSVDMFGFCESLNVSVCAAVVLNQLREALNQKNQLSLLTSIEQKLVLEHWIAKDTENADRYISAKYPHLFDWYMYVRSAKFYMFHA